MPLLYRRSRVPLRARRVAGRRYGVRRLRVARPMRMGKQQYNPVPTFVETWLAPQSIPANVGGTFSARINDVPQWQQYANLYNMYKVNWIKVLITPNFNSNDPATYWGSGRGSTLPTIAAAIQDTPFAPNPTSMADVLKMNGATIKTITSKWSKSFRPTAAVIEGTSTTGNTIAKREVKQYYTFDTLTTGNNPVFQGIAYFIAAGVQGADVPNFNVFYKMSFSLRDPK